jgi:hypothetical protein
MAACANPASSGPGTSTPTSTTAKQILSDLNVKEAANPPALTTTTTTGETKTIGDPDSWQPLKHSYAVFNPKAEACQIGLQEGSYYNSLYQDSSSSYAASTLFTSDQAWAKSSVKRSVAGDFDGDGIDEVAVFYTPDNNGSTLNFALYKSGSFSTPQAVSGLGITTHIGSLYSTAGGDASSATLELPFFNACVGDVDGDGKQEAILSDLHGVYILKISTSSPNASLIGSRTYNQYVVSLSAGDLDGDGKDEFVVGFALLNSAHAGFAVYDSSGFAPLTNPEVFNIDTGDEALEVCCGDFNADNLAELCIVEHQDSSHSYGSKCCLYSLASGMLKQNASFDASANQPFSLIYGGFPRALDWNGDGKDELEVDGYVYSNLYSGSPSSTRVCGARGLEDVAVGDVDGDGKKDLVLLTTNYQNISVAAYGLDSAGAVSTKKAYCSQGGALPTSAPVGLLTSICAGNVDDDSPRVKYSGHELQFTNPIVIAALASPPYYSDIAAADSTYNYNNWVTSFGKTTTQSSSSSSTVGFSVGSTVEYDGKLSIFGFTIKEFKFSASFAAAKNWEWTTTSSISKSITYSCNGGEDRVIFTAVPIDAYSYTVLASPNASEVGTTLKINIPRDYATYTVTRDFFNEHNGTLADVGSAVMPHTLGKVKTYPTEATKTSLISTYGGYEYAAQPAGQAGSV